MRSCIFVAALLLLFPLAAKAETAEQMFTQLSPSAGAVRHVSADDGGSRENGVTDAAPQSAAHASGKITAATMEQVRAFLDRFVDANKTASEQVAFFTDDVEYYDQGVIGKPAIVRDVTRYTRHWPYRNYRVVRIDYINSDPDSDRIFVSYTIDFEVANRSRTIAGTASYGALIGNLSVAPKIEAIEERVTERKSSSAPDR